MKSSLFFLLVVFVFFPGCTVKEKADMIIMNGNVITVDDNFSLAEAVAVKDGTVIFVGGSSEVNDYRGRTTEVIDASGLTVLPGLIDSHAHLLSLGDELYNLNISDCLSLDEVIKRVAGKVSESEPGEWIIGGRWDHTRWKSNRFPIHDRLSEVSPDNPVFLKRVDGNSAFVNKKALEMAGIVKETPDPPGGKIVRKDNGEPTGVLVNQAMNMVKDLKGKDSKEVFREKMMLAIDSCIKAGLTCVHEAGVGPYEIGLFKNMADEGQVDLRINAMLGEQEKPVFDVDSLESFFKNNRVESYADDYLCVNRVKLFFDGALGSRGAAFFEDYNDDPGNNGLLRISPDYITEVTRAALAANMSVATHCIGIRGNSLCLDAYREALEDFPGIDHRLRIEHAQVVNREDIDRFAESSIIPAMQPTHCTSDKDMIGERIGEERSEYAYAWRSFIDRGLVVPGGSDFPVESPDPFNGIYAAVSRKLPNESGNAVWHEEQSMTIEEAIKSFTIWGAYAGFREDKLGSIEAGKLADFTIIDKDLLSIDHELIPSVKVMYTITGGRIVYSAKE